ncbi:hypothetical protein ACHAXS_005557 [Conticribra weissflogii]
MKLSTTFAIMVLFCTMSNAKGRLTSPYRLEYPLHSKTSKSKSKSSKSKSAKSKSSKSSKSSGSKFGKSIKWIDEEQHHEMTASFEVYNDDGDFNDYKVDGDDKRHDNYSGDDYHDRNDVSYYSHGDGDEKYNHDKFEGENSSDVESQTVKPAKKTSKKPTSTPTQSPTSPSPTYFPTSANHTTKTTLTPTSNPPTYFPTPAEIEEASVAVETNNALFEFLTQVSDLSDLRDTTSPQGRALNWLSNTCDASIPDDNEDSHHNLMLTHKYILVAFYYALGGIGWLDSLNWLSNEHICFWMGIECSAMEGSLVKSITLPMNNLVGSLEKVEKELSFLKNFRELIVNDNWITGRFPKGLGGVGNDGRQDSVFRINVSNNSMSGNIDFDHIPKEKLISLKVAGNSFSGGIGGFAKIASLKQLDLSNNDFSGTVSSDFGNLSNLALLRFENNDKIVGTMPSSVCSLLDPIGSLIQLTASCGPNNSFECSCCTRCE